MTTNKDNENLEFEKGNTGIHEFILKDTDGQPYNLLGFTVRSQARLSPESEETIFDLTFVDGQNGNSFVKGIVWLRVSPEITAAMPNQCVYDILASSGSLTITVAKGRINTMATVTR